MTTLSTEHQRLAEIEAARADRRRSKHCQAIGRRTVRADYIDNGDARKLIEEFSFY